MQTRRRGGNADADRCRADLLILDDLGSEFNSAFLISSLYSLLNNRLGAKLPTIVTTNITDGALLEKLYTEKISSRLSAFVPAFLQAMTSAHRKQLNKTNGNANALPFVLFKTLIQDSFRCGAVPARCSLCPAPHPLRPAC